MVDMVRIRKEIERKQKEYLIRKRKSEEIWSKVSNHPPAVVPGSWKIYIANRSNGPCIYEYTGYNTNFWGTRQPNKLSEKLLFPNVPGRKYYKIGDKILAGEQDEDTLCRLFPELAKPEKKEAGWTDLLWWYLNEGEKEKYKFGWVIKSIQPNGKGGGRIGMTGIIHFEGYNVELKKLHYWNRNQLNDNFIFSSYDFTVILMLAKATATITVVALQGVSKAATAPVKHLMKKMIRKEIAKKGSKRFVKMICKETTIHLMKTAASASKEFIVVLAKELKKGDSERDLYVRATGVNSSWKIIEPAVREALVAFIGKIVEGLFAATFGDLITKNKEMKQLEKQLAEIYLKYIMISPFSSVLKAINTSYTKSQRTKKSMWEFLDIELQKNLNDSMKQVLMKDVTGALTG